MRGIASPSRHTSVLLPNNSPLRHLRQQALPPAHLRIITLRLERSLRRSTGPVRRLQMMDFRHMYVHALPLCILVPHNLVNKRMLSAAEEKALLKAKYETEEQTPPPITPGRQNGYSSPRTPSTTGLFPSPMWSEPPISRDQRQISPPRSPPPLLPRPPASYIRETAEEDARLQDELANGKLSAIAVEANGTTTETVTLPVSVAAAGASVSNDKVDEGFGLSRRPTLSFMSSWGSMEVHHTGMYQCEHKRY